MFERHVSNACVRESERRRDSTATGSGGVVLGLSARAMVSDMARRMLVLCLFSSIDCTRSSANDGREA